MYLEMKVCGFTIDSLARLPVVILKDAGEKNTLPIWINSTEAVSLAAQLISRDMSVQSGCGELMTKLMDQLRLKVARIVIDGVNDGIFDISIQFAGRGKPVTIKAKPSEALMMALKYDMNIYISEEVIARTAVLNAPGEDLDSTIDASRYIDFLENLDPKKMGSYPM